MADLKVELITKTMEYELKIIELENRYKEKNQNFDEKKMEAYINNKMKKETKELLNLNIQPALGLLNS